MKLFTKAQETKLLANGEASAKSDGGIDHKPVVKLFTPDAGATWLLSEITPDGLGYGLCDLGLGEPEIGYVSIEELQTVRGKLGLPVERDRWFTARQTITEYAAEARKAGRIVA
jgi:hypothetical protein